MAILAARPCRLRAPARQASAPGRGAQSPHSQPQCPIS